MAHHRWNVHHNFRAWVRSSPVSAVSAWLLPTAETRQFPPFTPRGATARDALHSTAYRLFLAYPIIVKPDRNKPKQTGIEIARLRVEIIYASFDYAKTQNVRIFLADEGNDVVQHDA